MLWVALAIDPVDRADWLLENLLVFIAVPLLVLTRNRLRFSNLSVQGTLVADWPKVVESSDPPRGVSQN